MDLREQFKKETGDKWEEFYSDGIHAIQIKAPNYNYILYLENKLKKISQITENMSIIKDKLIYEKNIT